VLPKQPPVTQLRSGACTAAIEAIYSITSSARTSSSVGNSIPSAFAVLRLRVNSIFTACSTGRLAGFSPLRISHLVLIAIAFYVSGPQFRAWETMRTPGESLAG
jgi:hypothetical protein